MSYPDPFRNAQNYRYGFLSAMVSEVLNRPVGSSLSTEETRLLRLASEFVADVLAGARLVSKGETGAVSASNAVRALGYALRPLADMELAKPTTEDVLSLFRSMQECLDQSVKRGSLSGSEDVLSQAATLFSYLNEGILSLLHQRSISVGEPRTNPT